VSVLALALDLVLGNCVYKLFACDRHLKELFALGPGTAVPAVNQFEYHVGLHDQELLALCEEMNITVTAYAPLGVGAVLKNTAVAEVAAAANRSAAEVAIRWLVQRGATTIPGANTLPYMAEDLGVFGWQLSATQMALLDRQTKPGRQYSDPHRIP
jgi:diketogulonate reductase-like aldo/keto reductase